ncbi:hypothetical protein TYRP_004363 [Tyrophagus putrescentiae]|nr:hypothetical protein TYRP_004363 [Tyrophagus putrescentiae]
MVTLLCVHRSTGGPVDTIGSVAILSLLVGNRRQVTPHSPRWTSTPQHYSREPCASSGAVYSGSDRHSLPLGRCILSSSSGGSPKTAPKLLRSISAVTALLASQIDTSLAYRVSLGVSRAIFTAQQLSWSFLGTRPYFFGMSAMSAQGPARHSSVG